MGGKAMEEFLEKVAERIGARLAPFAERTGLTTKVVAEEVARLVPLLEAGAECEYACCREGHWHYARMKYRAALQAAKGKK